MTEKKISVKHEVPGTDKTVSVEHDVPADLKYSVEHDVLADPKTFNEVVSDTSDLKSEYPIDTEAAEFDYDQYLLDTLKSVNSLANFVASQMVEVGKVVNDRMIEHSERINTLADEIRTLTARADAQRDAIQRVGDLQEEVNRDAEMAKAHLQQIANSGPLKMFGLGKLFPNAQKEIDQ